jgi:hypothetical protein
MGMWDAIIFFNVIYYSVCMAMRRCTVGGTSTQAAVESEELRVRLSRKLHVHELHVLVSHRTYKNHIPHTCSCPCLYCIHSLEERSKGFDRSNGVVEKTPAAVVRAIKRFI